MAEYDLDFADKLASTADMVDEKDHWGYDGRRVVIYLCRLSMEISLKAILERAGVPLPEIRRRNHDLKLLLSDLDTCEVLDSHPGEPERWVPGSSLRQECIDFYVVKFPIEQFIASTHHATSRYPNEIRYGSEITDFEPTYLIKSAQQLVIWARKHWSAIRRVRNDA